MSALWKPENPVCDIDSIRGVFKWRQRCGPLKCRASFITCVTLRLYRTLLKPINFIRGVWAVHLVGVSSNCFVVFWFSAGRTQCLVEVKLLLSTDIQSGFCCACGRGDGMQCFEVFCLGKKEKVQVFIVPGLKSSHLHLKWKKILTCMYLWEL